MTSSRNRLGDLVVAHYGRGLKEAARNARGPHVVYGSSGEVGRHDQALVQFPTIIIGRKGSVGAVTYAPEGGWPIDTTFYLEVPHPDRVDLRYLYWALSHAGLDRRAITTSIPGLNRDELYRTRIRLPPLTDQRRIAAVLDKADAIRRKRRESMRLLDEFLRSTFLEMFGDAVKNEKGWPTSPARSAISEIEPGSSVKGEAKPRGPGEWAVLKVSAVTSGWYSADECKVVAAPPDQPIIPRRGELLFSRANTRELVAATCLVDRDEPRVFLPDKLWRITPNTSVAVAEYLRFLLADSRVRQTLTRHATGTSGSMLNVSQEKLLRLDLPLPPLVLQHQFAELVWKAFAMRERILEVGDQVEELFGSLAQRGFRGDLW